MVVAAADDPFARLAALGGGRDAPKDLVDAVDAFLGAQIDLAHGEAERQQMHMRVVEAGDGDPPCEVDDFRPWPLQRGDLGRGARRQDLSVRDRQRFSEPLRQTEEDTAIQQYGIGACHDVRGPSRST